MSLFHFFFSFDLCSKIKLAVDQKPYFRLLFQLWLETGFWTKHICIIKITSNKKIIETVTCSKPDPFHKINFLGYSFGCPKMHGSSTTNSSPLRIYPWIRMRTENNNGCGVPLYRKLCKIGHPKDHADL